jgi:hypothetical protein
MKKLLLLTEVIIFLNASVDSDLNGVPDTLDKCPNTPFLTLVNIDGCPIKKDKIRYVFIQDMKLTIMTTILLLILFSQV